MDSGVATALADAFPDREVVETRPPGPFWNQRNRTVEVEFDDGSEAYLKVTVGGDPSGIVRERAVIPSVDTTCRVPVPAVLASGTAGGRPYLATASVDGELYHRLWGGADETKRAALARKVGVALARLHDCRFERHGHVVGGGAEYLYQLIAGSKNGNFWLGGFFALYYRISSYGSTGRASVGPVVARRRRRGRTRGRGGHPNGNGRR